MHFSSRMVLIKVNCVENSFEKLGILQQSEPDVHVTIENQFADLVIYILRCHLEDSLSVAHQSKYSL